MTIFERPLSSWKTNYYSYNSNNYQILEALALGIWLGEGSKGLTMVEVTNCDPAILKIWLDFMIKVCNVKTSDLKLRINLHDPSTREKVGKFWDEALGVSLPKYFYEKKKISNPKNKQLNGTCSIRFNSRSLRKYIGNRVKEVARS